MCNYYLLSYFSQMINSANGTLQPNSLLLNSTKLGSSTPSLQNASSSSSLNSNSAGSNRPPFYNINNNGSTSSLTSNLMNRQVSHDPHQFTQSVELSTNKYNLLAQYQQQQNFLSKTTPTYTNATGSNNSITSPPYNNALTLNSSFNSSMTHFRNNNIQTNNRNSIPMSATLNSLIKHQISAPIVSAPQPPITLQSAGSFNNPSYFQPPASANIQRHSQQENWFNSFNPNMKEQDLLDDGFLNLFKKSNSDVGLITKKNFQTFFLVEIILEYYYV
jgi:hypothetical protein